ncbi:MAG: hypothetical protein U0Y10_25050 [Spirosomataceae bacterium]
MRILVLIFAVGIGFFVAPYLGLTAYLHPLKWLLFAYFIAVSYLNHALMKQGFMQNREKFIVFSIASMVGRLVLGVMLILAIIVSGVPNRRLFIINFFVLYLLFTGFEIWSNLANLRRFSGGGSVKQS